MSKDAKIICRISTQLKDQIMAFAAEKNEAEAVVIREALREYFDRRQQVEPLREKVSGSAGKVVTVPAGAPKQISYIKTHRRK